MLRRLKFKAKTARKDRSKSKAKGKATEEMPKTVRSEVIDEKSRAEQKSRAEPPKQEMSYEHIK